MLKINARQWGKNVLVFSLLGPPVGWWTISLCSLVASFFDKSVHQSDVVYLILGLVTGALFSYILGGIPALVTGMLMGLVPPKLTLIPRLALAGVVGWMLTHLSLLLFSSSWEWDLLFNPLALLGGFSAIVCAWVARPKSPHPPPLPLAK